MNRSIYFFLLALAGIGFGLFFFITMGPPFIEDPDIIGALGMGFVNVYSTGYSVDVFACYFILLVWIVYERQTKGIKNGWICLIVGAVPGVATGLALYLYLRHKQLEDN